MCKNKKIQMSHNSILKVYSEIQFLTESEYCAAMHSVKATRLDGFAKPTVWEEFTGLANKHKSVNLGQGFPGWNSLQFVKDALVVATHDENANQYSRPAGDFMLTSALSRHYSPLFFTACDPSPIWPASASLLRRTEPLNPLTEITICNGASQAIYAVLQAFVQTGDEVVVFEPAFDLYAPQVQMAGGRCVYVSVVPPSVSAEHGDGHGQWRLDERALCAAVTEATRVIIVNSPHNPTGYLFSADDCSCIHRLCARFPRLLILADEVYENLCFDEDHLRIATQSELLFERTLTVSSAGKTFSATGWKVGWCLGPATLIRGVCLVNQWVQFSVCSTAQRAVARILEQAASPCLETDSGELQFGVESGGGAAGAGGGQGGGGQDEGGADARVVAHKHYYAYLQGMYRRKRDLLMDRLRPLAPFIEAFCPRGTFFVVCNISKFCSVYERTEGEIAGTSRPDVGLGYDNVVLSFRDYMTQHKADKSPTTTRSSPQAGSDSRKHRPLPPRPLTPGAGFIRRQSMSFSLITPPASPAPGTNPNPNLEVSPPRTLSPSPSPSSAVSPVSDSAARILRYTEDNIDDSLLLTPGERGVQRKSEEEEEDSDDADVDGVGGDEEVEGFGEGVRKTKLPLYAKLAPKFLKDKLRSRVERKAAKKQAKADGVLAERRRMDAQMEASCSYGARSAAINAARASVGVLGSASPAKVVTTCNNEFLEVFFRLARAYIAQQRVRGLLKTQIQEAEEEPEEVSLDWHFCRWLSIHVGVAAIPVSAFYTPASRAAHASCDSSDDYHLIRLCFAKPDDVLVAACDRLANCVS